jgi:DNA-binding response OmpR family regulator
MTEDKKKLLLVEDDYNTRQAMTEIISISMDNVDVHPAKDGPEAIDLACANNYPIALIDIMMPGMDGIDTANRILELQPKMKIIFLTGAGHEHYRERVLRIPNAEVYTKPIDVDILLDLVEKAIKE